MSTMRVSVQEVFLLEMLGDDGRGTGRVTAVG